MVGYPERLFLALAIPAWHAATRGRWWRAALLAGLSGLVRPDAMFMTRLGSWMAWTGLRGGRLANAGKACCGLRRTRGLRDLPDGAHRHRNALAKAQQALVGTCTWPHLPRP